MRAIDADALVDRLFNEMTDIVKEMEFGLEFIIGIGTAIEAINEEPTIDIFEGGKNETD